MASKEQLLGQIRREVTYNPLILGAFGEVDRKLFAPRGSKRLAYQNKVIPLRHGATMSQPILMAQMMALLGPGKENVLEVGTGSGYGAALLSKCVRWVHTVELNPFLARSASRRLKRLGLENITVHIGDGALGLPQFAPFDAILVTAGARDIPEDLEQQLAEGGRIVIPYGEDPKLSDLVLATKMNGMLLKEVRGRVSFVHLMSSANGGWTEETLSKSQRFRILRSIAEVIF